MNDATVIQAALILELQVIGTVFLPPIDTFPVSTIQYQVYFLYLNIDIITTDAQTKKRCIEVCPYNKLRLR